MTRQIRYNRSEESHRERSEAQLRRVLNPKLCETCGTSYTPKVGNQKRCPSCIRADPWNERGRKARGEA
jgi:rubrerythrin